MYFLHNALDAGIIKLREHKRNKQFCIFLLQITKRLEEIFSQDIKLLMQMISHAHNIILHFHHHTQLFFTLS